jgi:hypothetical protein
MISGLGGTTAPIAVADLATTSGGVDKTLALPLPGRGGSGPSPSAPPAPLPGPAVQPDSDHDPDDDAHADPAAGEPGPQHTAAAAATAVAGALGTAGQAAGQAAGAAAGKVGSFARAAADKAAEKRAARVEANERAERNRVSLEDALLAGDDDVEPPLPMLPPETAAAPTRDQSKMALAIIAAFVVVATLIGFWGVSQFGSSTGIDLSGSTPRPTVTVTGPTQTVTPGDTPTQEPSTDSAGEPLAILKATGFDPEGDGSERNSEAPRVYDGDTSTFWSSEGYATSNLGGLKPGVGVIVDLGQPAKVKQVTLELPHAADVTVYVSEDNDREGATELGTSAGKKGKVTITAKDAEVAGKYVLVWFTEVSRVDGGRHRATLAEITVR